MLYDARMKILILSDDFPPRGVGGAAAVATHVARGMKKKGHTVVVVTSVRDQSDAGEYLYEGMRVCAFASAYHPRWRAYRSLFNPVGSAYVRRILKREKPDVVHAHNIHQYISYNALKLAKKSGARVLLTAHDCMLFHYGKFTEFIDTGDLSVHTDYTYTVSWVTLLKTFRFWYNPFRNVCIRWYLKYVDSICAVSYELKKVLEANKVVPVHVVHNALDISEWISLQGDSEAWVKSKGFEHYARVLFVGTLAPEKGSRQLCDALKSLANSTQLKVALIIVGRKNEYISSLSVELENAGIKVVCTGWIAHAGLPTIYAAADCAVFPSICFDTFGMVALEAMASKKPVIATCFGGAREVVKDEETGYIINPYDTRGFSEKMKEILTDPIKKSALGDAGFKRARELFDIHIQTDAYEAMYTKGR